MIRLLFISRINLLAGRTNVYNLAKTCEAVNAQEGFHATLVTTDQESDSQVFFHKMAIHNPFGIVSLKVTNTVSKYSSQSWYEIIVFLAANLSLIWFLLKSMKAFDAVYFRDESLSPAALFAKAILRKKVFFEIHSVLESKSRQILNMAAIRSVDGVIAISAGLKRYYEKSNKNIFISLCSAAEDSWFDYSHHKEDFRKELRLPIKAYLIGYTGVVGANPNDDYYELDDIVKSLKTLPEEVICVVVGELNANADWLRHVARGCGVEDRLMILQWQERSIIPKYLQAFDIILIPKRKKDLVGDSPAKMFPALASRRPIIGGRAECIEEVLTDGVDAVIVGQNNPEGWAQAILKVYHDPNLAQSLSHQASITKGKYTWERRGIAIAKFIKQTINHP
ncbi:MAG: glycosyltransferase [Candidatus Levybacteria bacterium]|nr:glycosyltransferase [Candidatus Levybacteria bacterium]